MHIKIGTRVFSPGLWPSIATCFAIPLLVCLGLWQLDRADEKRSLFSTYMQRQQSEPVNLNRNMAIKNYEDSMLWRRVIARGIFDETALIMLDNQVMNSKAGYLVFTPFWIPDEKKWYLVNRGWLPAGLDRNHLPEFVSTNGVVTITGTAKLPQGTGILLGNKTVEELKPGIFRVNAIDIKTVSGLTDRKLMPYVVRLDAGSAAGYERNWPQPGSGEDVHLGYAFQWFALAILVLIIYIGVNMKKTNETGKT